MVCLWDQPDLPAFIRQSVATSCHLAFFRPSLYRPFTGPSGVAYCQCRSMGWPSARSGMGDAVANACSTGAPDDSISHPGVPVWSHRHGRAYNHRCADGAAAFGQSQWSPTNALTLTRTRPVPLLAPLTGRRCGSFGRGVRTGRRQRPAGRMVRNRVGISDVFGGGAKYPSYAGIDALLRSIAWPPDLGVL